MNTSGVCYSGVTAKNVSSDPKTVEVHLKAVKGNWSFDGTHVTKNCYMYEDEEQAAGPSIPGPLIVADVGDTVIVRLKNELAVDTTLHWHGIDVPAPMDGSNISQPSIAPGECFTYKFVLTKAAMFWYHSHVNTKEQVERGLHGGLLVRDASRENALLAPKSRCGRRKCAPHEHVFILDDVLLDANYQFAPFDFPGATDTNLAEANKRAQQTFNGRVNQPSIDSTNINLLLVNGKANFSHTLQTGIAERWRMVSVTNSTFIRFALRKTDSVKMWRIGGDGGILERPIEVTVPVKRDLSQFEVTGLRYGLTLDVPVAGAPLKSEGVLLTPGERADVLVWADPAASLRTAVVQWYDTWRGRHIVNLPSPAPADDDGDGLYAPAPLIKLKLVKKSCCAAQICRNYQPPTHLAAVPRIDVMTNEPQTLLFNFGHAPIAADGKVTFFATTTSNNPMLPPGAGNIPIPFPVLKPVDAKSVTVDESTFVRVQNFTRGGHNFHQHGFQFQLIQYETYQPGNGGVVKNVYPAPFLEFKDTLWMPGRPTESPGSKSVAVLRIRFDDAQRSGQAIAYPADESGTADPIVEQPVHSNNQNNDTIDVNCTLNDFRSKGWLAHCHILEHSDAGMMSVVRVKDTTI